MWELWLIILTTFILLNIWTNKLYYCSLSLSALLTLFYTFSTNQLFKQLIFFFTFFVVFNAIFYLLDRHLHFTISHHKNSLDTLIGKKGTVISLVGSHPTESGIIKLDGETWRAISAIDKAIPNGHPIKVQAISGVHIIITPIR